ncbi:quinone oxidoreductase family protein [Thermaerobacillus caldiproteolyticus]|uniref:quinone oxidoreductase family protein n=1 Tax=Thermaerobacillus caldiproteolyticus TaxID=247480 RepID=UPI00188AA61F|nr:zinc-binding alcohol dehydrogenase family protein [Anoxybacillus caldiproteolyticus]QPA32578.1 zinc-binding alcohol dehydrogenase family protein [Anoxybacillus caldiproteolyticus]
MKAAVLHKFGEVPRYEEFPDPVPGPDEVLIQVKAVALENVDKMMAEGKHFASRQFLSQLPAIVGFDGIGELPDGKIVGFGGIKPPYGAMAEKVIVPKANTVPVPEGIDAVTAAALPASALSSLFPLKWGAKLQPGETVLINGATGVSGKLAVQIAKLLGAGRVVGTGRNPESMKRVLELGADAVIDLKQSDEELADSFIKEAGEGYDVILDFLWGRPTEILIKTFVPHELVPVSRRVRLVQIGEKAGSTISLSADALRTSGLEIFGGAAGWTPEAINEATNQVWAWIKEGKLSMDIETVPLKDIESVWKRTDFQGQRIVIVP